MTAAGKAAIGSGRRRRRRNARAALLRAVRAAAAAATDLACAAVQYVMSPGRTHG